MRQEIDAQFVVAVQANAVSELPGGVEVLPRPTSSGLRRAAHGLRSLGESDLVHGLDVDIPLRSRAPTVVTVHDLSVFDVPWAFSRHRSWGERALVAQAIGRADAIIAVSGFTAERVHARFGRVATVVHEAPDPEFAPPASANVLGARARYGLPERFVLHVGNVERRKNLTVLAEACRQLAVPLVLAGVPANAEYVPAAARLLGYVPRRDLPALYGAAPIVAYPSRYEGFGLPPLEAMACGAPVVASRLTSLPEVLTGGAELVAVDDEVELAGILRDLLHDEDRRLALARAGVRHAARFSWSRTVEGTAGVYRSLGIPVGPGNARPAEPSPTRIPISSAARK
jgi:glycosyltransferase involved in cell wall biosynthesis